MHKRGLSLVLSHKKLYLTKFVNYFVGLLLLAADITACAASSSIDVCVDYGCDVERTVLIRQAPWSGIRNLFNDVDSADAERVAVAKSISRLEHIAGDQVGTSGDFPKNSAGYGDPGQLDCIAESINTERYLRLLETASLLRWHRVIPRVVRRPFLFNTHWTAVIRETDSGKSFAVDSWYGKNGDEAFVINLEEWRRGASPVEPRSSRYWRPAESQ
jgi:hypothetical protein